VVRELGLSWDSRRGRTPRLSWPFTGLNVPAGVEVDSLRGMSATRTTGIGTCQRVLIVANNVAIDLEACSTNQSDSQSGAAVNIAQRIAAKVPA
jgi:PknH-like extracellular domain